MISKKLNEAFNEQLKKELYSGHLYLSMAAYCASIDLPGFANFFVIQEQEERFHAMKFFNYIAEKEGKVKIFGIDQPPTEFESLKDVFEKTLEHERKVTGLINDLMSLTIEEKDYASQSFLKWFIDEQVEEEATFLNILKQIRMVGNEGTGLFMLDKEMGQRVFTPPASG